MYVLNLSEDNRVLSAWDVIEGQDYTGMPIVDKRPEDVYPGCNTEDCYYIDGEYIYDPQPKPDDPEPDPSSGEDLTADEMAAAIMEGVNEI